MSKVNRTEQPEGKSQQPPSVGKKVQPPSESEQEIYSTSGGDPQNGGDLYPAPGEENALPPEQELFTVDDEGEE